MALLTIAFSVLFFFVCFGFLFVFVFLIGHKLLNIQHRSFKINKDACSDSSKAIISSL